MLKRWQTVIRNSSVAIAIALVFACRNAGSPAPAAQGSTVGMADRPVTVCEILKDPTRYRGQTVTVTGIYWQGLREQCGDMLVTAGHRWPNAINLVDSQTAGSELAHFQTDTQSWDELDKIVVREAKAGGRKEIWATVVGVLSAPAAYVRADGEVVGGYGHLGAFPAELVVQRVAAVEVKPIPTYDYSEVVKLDRRQLAK